MHRGEQTVKSPTRPPSNAKHSERDEQFAISSKISEDVQARAKNSEDQVRRQVDELRAELYSACSREKVKDEEMQTLLRQATQAEMGQYRNSAHEEGQQQHLSEAVLQAWQAQLLQAKFLSVQRLTECNEEWHENNQLAEAWEMLWSIARHQADEKQSYRNSDIQPVLRAGRRH